MTKQAKLKTRKVSEPYYEALKDRVYQATKHLHGSPYLSLQIVAVTDEFVPTQCLGDARWLFAGLSLIEIDGVGDMITLEVDYDLEEPADTIGYLVPKPC